MKILGTRFDGHFDSSRLGALVPLHSADINKEN